MQYSQTSNYPIFPIMWTFVKLPELFYEHFQAVVVTSLRGQIVSNSLKLSWFTHVFFG